MFSPPDKTLALKAYEQVLEMIQSHVLKPGTLIQGRRLAGHLNMSRTPLGDALAMLEAEGLLVRNHGRGLQVRNMDVRDFMDNLDIRLILEPEAAKLAVGQLDHAHVGDLAARIERIRETASRGGPPPERDEVRQVDEELHAMIAEATQNARMAAIIRSLRQQTRMFDLRSLPERVEDSCAEHLAILNAIVEGKSAEAAEAMRGHLSAVRRAIIRRLTAM